MKIAIAGTGYVGLANAMLLAQHHEVVALDIDAAKVARLNARQSPIDDADIAAFLARPALNFRATLDPSDAYEGAEFVIVSTPTNYDPARNFFDTRTVESVVADVARLNPKATAVIKSTIPVGYVERVRADLNCDRVIFSPEFLREGKALYDNLYPSRIVVGEHSERAQTFANLLLEFRGH